MAWARPRAGGGSAHLQDTLCKERLWTVGGGSQVPLGLLARALGVELPSRKVARLRKSAGLSRKFLSVVQWKYLEDTKPTSSTE